MSRAAAWAITASWCVPRADWTSFMRLANRRAFLPSFLPSAGRRPPPRTWRASPPSASRAAPRRAPARLGRGRRGASGGASAGRPGRRPGGVPCPRARPPRGQRRAVEQPAELGAQRPVPLGVERVEHRLPAACLKRGEVRGDPCLRGPEHKLGRHGLQPGVQVVGEHLVVAGGAEHAAEPLQLRAQVLSLRLGHDPGERLQRAAQPPDRDAHLVHGVRLVAADRQVKGAEPGRLGVEVGEHHLAGRRVPGEPPAVRGPAAVRGQVRAPRASPGLVVPSLG